MISSLGGWLTTARCWMSRVGGERGSEWFVQEGGEEEGDTRAARAERERDLETARGEAIGGAEAERAWRGWMEGWLHGWMDG